MRLVHHGTYPYQGEEYRSAGTMLSAFAGMTFTDVPGTKYQRVELNQTHRDQPGFNYDRFQLTLI